MGVRRPGEKVAPGRRAINLGAGLTCSDRLRRPVVPGRILVHRRDGVLAVGALEQ